MVLKFSWKYWRGKQGVHTQPQDDWTPTSGRNGCQFSYTLLCVCYDLQAIFCIYLNVLVRESLSIAHSHAMQPYTAIAMESLCHSHG